MHDLAPAPVWMHPLPADPPPVDAALADLVAVTRGHDRPSRMCSQCLSPEMQTQLTAAAHMAQGGITPEPQMFGQIYFEHPNCVGSESTIKLFLPHGLKTMLTGTPPPGFGAYSYPEVLETALKAGFWFWDPDILTATRALAARLFHNWFRRGHYDWPMPDRRPDDLIGPGDDIIQLCITCLIDPAELVSALGRMHTPQADELMTIVGSCTMQSPFYVSMETGIKDGHYKSASDAISASLATREALGVLHVATPAWLQAAFFRNAVDHPDLAADLSKFETYYQVQTVDAEKAALADILVHWPNLPIV